MQVCHCRLCQRAIGAAFNGRVLMALRDVALHGPVGRYHSTPDLARGFCTVCGTTVFSERRSAGVIGLTSGSLDQADLFQPTDHIWTSSQQSWIRLDDGLPRHPEAPP
jgi:hypothetical protein